MADTKTIVNHIKSITDTRKITNAMYLISSTKLQKARRRLDVTMPFYRLIRSEIGKIVRNGGVKHSRFLVEPGDTSYEDGVSGILMLTADRGLAGAYNQNVIKETMKVLSQHEHTRLFIVGEYGKHYCRSHHIPYDEAFDFPDVEPSLYQARRIGGYIMDLYERGELSQIYVVYTNLKNALTSEVESFRLLPFDTTYFDNENVQDGVFLEFEYVPSPIEVMEKSIPVYCIGIMYSVLVYSYCCEHNDRRMAMDLANKNADELIKELRVQYQHLRQSSITQEITEISASVKASQRR